MKVMVYALERPRGSNDRTTWVVHGFLKLKPTVHISYEMKADDGFNLMGQLMGGDPLEQDVEVQKQAISLRIEGELGAAG